MSDQTHTTHRIVTTEFVGPTTMRQRAAGGQIAHSNSILRPVLTMNQEKIEEVHSWTYACLRARMNGYGSVPFRAYSGSQKSPTPAPDSHPLARLLDRPNPTMGSTEFWRLHRRHLDIDGVALILLDPFMSESGKTIKPLAPNVMPVEMWPQRASDYTAIVNQPDGSLMRLTPYQIRGQAVDRSVIAGWEHVRFGFRFPANQIIFETIAEGSPLAAARIPAEGDFLAGKFSRNWISNDCMPSGWYTHERVMNDEEYRQFKARSKNENEGIDNAGKTMLLEGGMTYTPNPITARDMQWTEGRDHWRDELCAVFGVPKSILSIGDEAKYANHLSTIRVFTEQTIFPLLTATADAIWAQLLSRIEGGRFWMAADTAGVPSMQSDQMERMTMAQQAVFMGVPLAEAIKAFNLPFDSDEIAASEQAEDEIHDGEFMNAGQQPAAPAPAPQPVDVAKLQSLIQSVADGMIPAESAITIITVSFPSVTMEQAKAMVGPAEALAAEEDDTSEQNSDESPEGDNNTTPPKAADDSAKDGDESDQSDGDTPDDEEEDAERALHLDGGRAANRANGTGLRRLTLAREKADRRRAARAAASNQWLGFKRSKVQPTERKFERRMTRELNAQRREILAQFDALTQRKGATPDIRADRFLTPDDVTKIQLNMAKWNARFSTEFNDIYRQMLIATGVDVASLKEGFVFDAANPKWVEFINARVGEKLVDVNTTTMESVRNTLRQGLLAGETSKEIRERLRTLPDFSRARARTVAVTEMGYTVNETKRDQFEEFGFDQVIWLTSGTDRVRESHARAERDGPRRRGDQFSNGLRWPYDDLGPAEEVINCECGLGIPLE